MILLCHFVAELDYFSKVFHILFDLLLVLFSCLSWMNQQYRPTAMSSKLFLRVYNLSELTRLNYHVGAWHYHRGFGIRLRVLLGLLIFFILSDCLLALVSKHCLSKCWLALQRVICNFDSIIYFIWLSAPNYGPIL